MNIRRANEILKQYNAGHSMKYVLKLKNVGDWLLKKNIIPLLQHAADNETLLGTKVRFSPKILSRSMCKAIRFRKEDQFKLVKRLMNDDVHAKSEGTRISMLIVLLQKCAGQPLWENRLLLWMGASKLEQVMQRATQQLNETVVQFLVLKKHIPENMRYFHWWNKGIAETSEPLSAESARAAMRVYKLLWSLKPCAECEIGWSFVVAARNASMPLLKKLYRFHKKIPGPLHILFRAAMININVMALLHTWKLIVPNMSSIIMTAAYANNVDCILYLMDLGKFEPDRGHVAAAIRGHSASCLHVLMCCFQCFKNVPNDVVWAWGRSCARYCSVGCLEVLLNNFDALETHTMVHQMRRVRVGSEIGYPPHMKMSFEDLMKQVVKRLPPPRMKCSYKQNVVGKLIAQTEKKPTCGICLDAINAKTVYMLECGHMFHNKCLAQCRKAQCPECREAFVFEFE